MAKTIITLMSVARIPLDACTNPPVVSGLILVIAPMNAIAAFQSMIVMSWGKKRYVSPISITESAAFNQKLWRPMVLVPRFTVIIIVSLSYF